MATTSTQSERADDGRVTLTEREFCKLVGISQPTAFAMRKAGKLGHCRVGRRVLYLERHIEEFLVLTERKPKAA